jgi:hypothetical protein
MVKKYIVTEDSPITGKTSYTVIENPDESNPSSNPKPNVNEVKELIDYSKEMRRLDKKSFGNTNPVSDKDKELERDALQWKKYFKDNQGKIPNEFPKTIFDNKKVIK